MNFVRIVIAAGSIAILSIGCGADTLEDAQASQATTPAVSSAADYSAEQTQESSAEALVQGSFPVVPDATYETNGDVTVITIPVTDCAQVTATPIVVGDYLLMPMHDSGHGCQPRGAYADTLLGYSFSDGQLHLLYDGYSGEATPYYDAATGLVYWDITLGGTVAVLDASTFTPVETVSTQATSDSSGVLVDGLYYFGTINTPEALCQDPVNLSCGSIFAVDSSGNVIDQTSLDDGFRTWITGLTTDGQYIYAGGGPQHLGDSESQYLYGCSVVKLDLDLNVVASADPGDVGCHRTGLGFNDEDAVAGEVVLGPDSVWVQFTHANDSRNQATLIHYDRDLVEQCRVELNGGPIQVSAYYGAATVDKDGNAYVPFTLPSGGPQPGTRAVLLKVTPDCQTTVLAEIPNSKAFASPTLVDDQYVLFATDGRLGIYTLDGQLVQEYTLGSDAQVSASPVIEDGVIYVLSGDATLTIIRNTGMDGYGTAYWPRYRHDNVGSGSVAQDADGDGVADGSDLCPGTPAATAVDGGGCSDAQVDADGDSVCDPGAPGNGPSGCTGSDNCPRWANPTQTLPPWTVPADDPDCDGFPSTANTGPPLNRGNEAFIGTTADVQCAADSGANNEPLPDAWPMDFNDDQRANTVDVLQYVGRLNYTSPDPDYVQRLDLDASGRVNTVDVLKFVPVLNQSCT